jgi:hypothetical protein
MMKIVWSIICLQYFGSINKMNLKNVIVIRAGTPEKAGTPTITRTQAAVQ